MSHDFDLSQGWADHKTTISRRKYLIEIIADCSGGQIVTAKFKPGGFDYDTSHLFLVEHDVKIARLIKLQLQVIDKVKYLPKHIIFQSRQWQDLAKKMKYLSREFKIHIQPQEDKIPLIISRLVELIMADAFLLENIAGFKTRVRFGSNHLSENRGTIVLYLPFKKRRKDAQLICQQVLARLKAGLVDYEQYAEGRLPIYNFPVTDLISLIQVGTDAKFQLSKILGERRFDLLFPKKYNQALLMDEDPQFYVPESKCEKIKLPIVPIFKPPDITKFPLIAMKVVGMIEYMPQEAYCCPRCRHLHKFECTSNFWIFDCDDCDKDGPTACQTVLTKQGEVQVFVCEYCKRPYRVFRNDEERYAVRTID
ncbi:hypothetical protein ACFL2U_03135 [Patescibacteria group bacterium]